MPSNPDDRENKNTQTNGTQSFIVSVQPTSSTESAAENSQSSKQSCKHETKKKKNKCRGNRKLQRYKAKLRKRGFNNEAITSLINNYNQVNQDQNVVHESTIPNINIELLVPIDNQETSDKGNIQENVRTTKRKRATKSNNITESLSQISISNIVRKRPRSKTMDNIQEQQELNETTSDWKPKYLKLSDQIFKQMLSKSLSDADKFVQLLDTSEKLKYVRTYAHLLNNVFYLKLEESFWEHYKQVCISESIWSSPMLKNIAKENNLCRFKFKTQVQLEKHYQLIQKRLRTAENNLNQYKQQPIHESIDINTLSTIMTAFVRQGQHKLCAEFERKKLILQFDAIDHRLIKTFYNLNPTDDQIRSAKIIWQAAQSKLYAEEQLAILKQRIYTKRLPSSLNILDHSIDNVEYLLKQSIINRDKSATLSFRRLKTIAQFKYDIMTLEMTTVEEIIRSHVNIIADEKKKLIDSAGGQVPIPKSLVQIMNAIAARQSNMVQRSQCILKKKLSVFDDAPMTINMAGAVGANIVQSFKTGLTNNCISYSDQRAKDFFTAIENVLRRLYTTPLRSKLLARIQYESRLIRSTRHHIKKSNIIIRPTDKSKVLHLGSVHDYHRKALQYMSETNAYNEITSGINPCQNHLQMVLTLIDPMLKNKDINLQLWKQYMRPNAATIELAHLYFIPKPHKIGTPLRPIVSSIKAAATGVSHFLDILLRPMFNQVTKATTFINGIDFVRQIENYRNSGRFLPTTLFVTFDITNLYTMIPRHGAIAALQNLSKHADNRRIHGMTIDTITRLARLVLDTNCFVYNNKYYQQIRGGAMGSPFTMTLANVYMWEWEQTLIEYQRSHMKCMVGKLY
ncbi:unnamed protein product [Rotaria socialis]|uniref:Reverse transcriptase domain-containing protein n=5 Tax=Rotaria TaxID=231623 RepID=A0A817MWG7_9BILA|nr:unnamed protein product [Rotaria socialis]